MEQTAQQWQWTWNKDDKQLATVNGEVHDKLEQAKGVDFCILTFSGPGFLVLS